MSIGLSTPTLSPEVIRQFMAQAPPFDTLPPLVLSALAWRSSVEKVPAGTVMLERGRSEVTHLRLIYSGRVKVFLKDDNGELTWEDFRGPREAVGQLALLRDSLSNLEVVAEKETTCLLISKEDFLELIRTNLGFANYYLKALSDGYVGKAFDRLQRTGTSVGSDGSIYLFTAQVGDVVRRRPITIAGSATIQEAAALMTERRVGCLLVINPAEEIAGIVTDRDFRNKVVAPGLPVSTPLVQIMTSPVQSIPAHMVCFDAMLEMMKRRVHHLVLERRGQIVGVISGHDLMVLQGSSPLYLVREIMETRRIENLFELSLKSPRVIQGLIREGAKASSITRMITLINDYIRTRLLTLVETKLGTPPVPYCWLLMGSEGRREQTFRTDQDNGLIYRDPESEVEKADAAEYFRLLAHDAVQGMVSCGFPRCKGEIMASNPMWCQPNSVWTGYFDRWVQTPEPKEVLHATIFFDFRPGPGNEELGRGLRTHLLQTVKGREVFFRLLAKDCLTTPASLSFFKQFLVDKSGPFKNRLDLKTKGMTPIVDFARLMSLRHGIRETNTLDRLQLLGEGGHISREMSVQASQSFEFQMQLRLIHQHQMDEEALEPDNYIDPNELSELDRGTLKDALGVINDIKTYLKEAFQLASV